MISVRNFVNDKFTVYKPPLIRWFGIRTSTSGPWAAGDTRVLQWYLISIEEGFTQKSRQTVLVAFWGKMAAHLDCVADELIHAGRASNTVTCVLIKYSKWCY